MTPERIATLCQEAYEAEYQACARARVDAAKCEEYARQAQSRAALAFDKSHNTSEIIPRLHPIWHNDLDIRAEAERLATHVLGEYLGSKELLDRGSLFQRTVTAILSAAATQGQAARWLGVTAPVVSVRIRSLRANHPALLDAARERGEKMGLQREAA